MYVDNWQTQLRKGMLDIVILNLLSHGPCHGYEMVQQLKKVHGLKMREGNIYPILARLEQEYPQTNEDRGAVVMAASSVRIFPMIDSVLTPVAGFVNDWKQ